MKSFRIAVIAGDGIGREVIPAGIAAIEAATKGGASLTFTDSILRHAGEARGVTNSFRALSATQQNQIITFLKSL